MKFSGVKNLFLVQINVFTQKSKHNIVVLFLILLTLFFLEKISLIIIYILRNNIHFFAFFHNERNTKQNQLEGRKGLSYFTAPYCFPRGSQGGNSSRNLEAGAIAQTLEKSCLLVSLMAFSTCFFIQTRTPYPEVTPPTLSGFTVMKTGQFDGGNFPIEILSSKVTTVCAQLTKLLRTYGYT